MRLKFTVRTRSTRGTDNGGSSNGNGGNTYQDVMAVPGAPRSPLLNNTEVVVLEEKKKPGDTNKDVVGLSQEKAKEMWQYQLQSPTCMIAALTGVLRERGIRRKDENNVETDELITYPDVLFEVAEVRDQNGNVLHKANLIDEYGKPYYVVTIHADRIAALEPSLAGNVNTLDEIKRAYAQLNFHNLHIDKRAFTVENVANQATWGGMFDIFNYYNVPAHSGFAQSTHDIVTELEAGNPLIVYVDPNEIWGQDFATAEQQAFDGIHINGVTGTPIRSGYYHNVVLTRIDFTNPKNPVVVINDSGHKDRKGPARTIPLVRLLAAMADYRFRYIAPGNAIGKLGVQQARRVLLEAELTDWYSRNSGENAQVIQQAKTTGFLMHAIKNPNLLALIQQDPMIPDNFTHIAQEYLSQEIVNQFLLEERFNIPRGTLQSIYEDADVLEYTKPVVISHLRTTLKKSELKTILLKPEIFTELKFTQTEIDSFLNVRFLRSRGFTQAEIDEILVTEDTDN